VSTGTILLAAGGTGGHLFPAEALAGVLAERGVPVALATDGRAAGYGAAFPPEAVHLLTSATFTGRSPLAVARTLSRLGRGLAHSMALIRRLKPSAVVGFGGYPSIPAVLAAQLLGVPTVVHEQNAVLGRANRLLARRARKVATGFAKISKAPEAIAGKTIHIGNPVRSTVRALAGAPYGMPEGDDFHLLVFGGSQGARIMSEVVPAAVSLLPPELRQALKVVHQARAEDAHAAAQAYGEAHVIAQVAPFFADLPTRIAGAHLVICRAGASTVAELAAIGRPSVLVPLPGSLDQDQLTNARALEAAGGGTVMQQKEMTPAALAALISDLVLHPDKLAAQAVAARNFGIIDASDRLADLVQEIAAGSRGLAASGGATNKDMA
jgi:UDP-N-acetylglucosamine--N-acetylmuramyl-(pentapeptide) pyrophosphoryl-undecaprenol N-acetylglucosamine transferase